MKTLSISTLATLVCCLTWAITAAPTLAAGPAPVPAPAANIAHGQYLATHVAMCIECHSPRDEGGNIIPGQEFTGGSMPVKPNAAWASRAPRNRGLLGYDDRLAMRLLTEGGIGRDGGQLLLPMPRFRMSQEDATDVIAYLRSLH
jgi:mono/diheme cytochrome c family protein